MTKNLFFAISFLVSCLLTMTSCSQDMDYKKACEDKNFEKAYEIIDKLKEKTSEAKVNWEENNHGNFPWTRKAKAEYEEAKKISDEAERYVVLQESLMVLESEGTNGLMRIVGIAKEHNAESWLYSELFDVANKIGDKDLAERIQNIISSEKKKGTMMEDFDLDNDMESMMDTE